MAFEVHTINLHLGNFSGATELPLAYIPDSGGGVTVLSAWLTAPGAGTAVGGQVVTLGNVATGGTPAIDGTVAAFAGTIVAAAGVVHSATVSGAFVQPGKWLGYDQTSGTVPAGTEITVAYVMGRGSA